MTRISFLGATQTVTGSRHLLEIDGKKMLIDCGMFQGIKKNRLRNWEPFPVPAADIDYVFLTHAHLDHSGFLPRLCKEGFSGPVYCTPATADIAAIILRDSAHLQEEDALWANKKGFSKHKPALPLYTTEDAEEAIARFSPVQYGDDLFISDSVRVKFKDAGHILGSSIIDFKRNIGKESRKIVFSGDLGRPKKIILKEPTQAYDVDYLIIESTYGNRLHQDSSVFEDLARVINESINRRGVLLIPAFSVGRTQTLLFVIRELEEKGLIPSIPVFMDSPMAINVTNIFNARIADQNIITRVLKLEGKEIYTPKHLKICRSRDESKAINAVKGPGIILSASGMATGGRILHHLVQRLPSTKNTMLFIGYQATGTRGRAILDGKEEIKIHGSYVPVNAHIETLHGFSGHADYNEILAWLMGFNAPPTKTFVVHGEEDASTALAQKIRDTLGWDVVVPSFEDGYDIDF